MKKPQQVETQVSEWALLIAEDSTPLAYIHVGCGRPVPEPFKFCPDCGKPMKYNKRKVVTYCAT